MSQTTLPPYDTDAPPTHRPSRALFFLYFLVFCSGGLALVYEILWMRRFVTIFGASSPAVASVLMGMFLGLGVGSWFWGDRASRSPHPVRTYAWLEIGVGVGALLVELFLHAYDSAYPTLYQSLASHPAGFLVVKTTLVVAALFVSTFCMGGTLPLLGQAMAAEAHHLGVSVGGVYATNTAGAALGAISVPILLLPRLTVGASYLLAVLASLSVGGLAFLLNRAVQASLFQHPTPKRGPDLNPSARRVSQSMLMLLVGLSGLWLFVLQVSWSRMFSQIHENSIYSLSLILAVLLLGLAAGTGSARVLLKRGWDPLRGLGLAWILSGLIVLWTPRLFWELTGGLAYINVPGGWTAYGLRLFGLTLPTVFLPSLFAGMALPFLMELLGHYHEELGASGRVVGRLIAVNTLGSIVGSVAAAFLFPSWLGLWGTLATVGVAMVFLGDLASAAFKFSEMLKPRRIIVLVLLGLSFVGGLNPFQLPRTRFRADRGERLLSLEESSHGIVAVVEGGNSRRIKLNNFYVLGGTASTGDERMQGHLPLLLHPNPKRVAFLGLGTGITAGASLLHPVDHVTAVEIVPEVIRAVGTSFAEANLGVVQSSRVEVVSEDARDFLRGSGRTFDVIVGDLFVPWHHGESSLYTADHFSTVRRGLAPGGLFCQWLPLFQLSEEEFNMIAATFLDVFPRTTLWRGDFSPGQPAVALVGQLEEAPIDPAVVERRVRELKPDLANPFLIHPAAVWMYLAGELSPADPRFANARRNQENQPWLELLGPLHHAGTSSGASPLFVGQNLERYLEVLRSKVADGALLQRLEPQHQQWRLAGGRLCAASIAMLENRPADAQRLLQQVSADLPPEIRKFFGGEGQTP